MDATTNASTNRPWILSITALLLISLSPGCGGTSATDEAINHKTEGTFHISINPAAADAKDSPNGIVQFAAFESLTGGDPNVAIQLAAPTWCIAKNANTCAGINDVTSATIYANVTGPGVVNGIGVNGFAQCSPGFTGQVTILAGVGGNLMVANPPPFGAGEYASATLTCP